MQTKTVFIAAFVFLFFRISYAGPQDKPDDSVIPGLTRTEIIQRASEYFARGKELIQKEDFLAADEEFKKAQVLLGGSAQASKDSAADKKIEKFKGQDSKEAIEYYLKIVAFNPENPDIYYNLALEYLKGAQYTEAAAALKQVVRFNPGDLDAYYNLGVLYDVYLGDKTQAADCYSQYLKLGGIGKEAIQVKSWLNQLKKESLNTTVGNE